jgi:dTDP-4-dehydrorhamnose 3,5-epimerase
VQIAFTPTPISGAYLLDAQRLSDDRGFFALAFSSAEFADRGLVTDIAQVNVAYTARRGTLRGLHYQQPPKAEVKVVRCVRGAFFDVIVDLRRDSPSFRKWFGVELTSENRRSLYVPQGCAHGYLTLSDDVEACYLVSEFYSPEHYRGVRWNDPAFGITWPFPPDAMHPRDAAYPDFTDA